MFYSVFLSILFSPTSTSHRPAGPAREHAKFQAARPLFDLISTLVACQTFMLVTYLVLKPPTYFTT